MGCPTSEDRSFHVFDGAHFHGQLTSSSGLMLIKMRVQFFACTTFAQDTWRTDPRLRVTGASYMLRHRPTCCYSCRRCSFAADAFFSVCVLHEVVISEDGGFLVFDGAQFNYKMTIAHMVVKMPFQNCTSADTSLDLQHRGTPLQPTTSTGQFRGAFFYQMLNETRSRFSPTPISPKTWHRFHGDTKSMSPQHEICVAETRNRFRRNATQVFEYHRNNEISLQKHEIWPNRFRQNMKSGFLKHEIGFIANTESQCCRKKHEYERNTNSNPEYVSRQHKTGRRNTKSVAGTQN